jgi:ABC-type polysaccharide/polyol phosphate export permease
MSLAFSSARAQFTSQIAELWKYRHLLRMLVERDLKARYKGSLLGIAWSFLQPLGMMAVITLVMTKINPSPDGMPRVYVRTLAGLLAWNFFNAGLVSGTGSIIANAGLVKKVYFPRILLPISSVLSSTLNYFFALPMFILVALISGHGLSWTILLLPVALLIQIVFTTGLTLLFSSLNVYYRDTQFILDLAMLALFFLTPVWYDLRTFNASTMTVLGVTFNPALWLNRLNPMASLVNIYQDLMYLGQVTVFEFWIRTAITAIVIFVIGLFVFQRLSKNFGEEV